MPSPQRRPAARFGILAVIGLLLAACSPGQPDFVELATLARPASPNTFLACPAARTSAAVDVEPPLWPVAVEALERTWLDTIAAAPRTTLVASDGARRRHLFVQRTAVLRFPDVIQLDVLPVEPAGATVCVYSRSVYGYSDLGANRRRVEGWLERLRPDAG